MNLESIVPKLKRLFRNEEADEPSISRRDALCGLGIVGAFAVAGSTVLMSSDVHAQSSSIELAQYGGRWRCFRSRRACWRYAGRGCSPRWRGGYRYWCYRRRGRRRRRRYY